MSKELTPKFQDGEKVLLDGKIVTVNEWGYTSRLKRYTYTIVEKSCNILF